MVELLNLRVEVSKWGVFSWVNIGVPPSNTKYLYLTDSEQVP